MKPTLRGMVLAIALAVPQALAASTCLRPTGLVSAASKRASRRAI